MARPSCAQNISPRSLQLDLGVICVGLAREPRRKRARNTGVGGGECTRGCVRNGAEWSRRAREGGGARRKYARAIAANNGSRYGPERAAQSRTPLRAFVRAQGPGLPPRDARPDPSCGHNKQGCNRRSKVGAQNRASNAAGGTRQTKLRHMSAYTG
jgi:hypothetical protein